VGGPIAEADLIGIGAEDTYVKKRQMRFARSCAWLHSPSTPLQQSVGATLLLPLIALMGDFFDRARFDSSSKSSIAVFCSEADSPSRKVFAMYLRYLAEEDFDVPERGFVSRAGASVTNLG
jgi:hypothetical protein